MNYIYFWKPEQPYGYFSQWYNSDFTDIDGIQYHCAEQYMMYQKALLFKDDNVAQLILQTTNPKTMRELGRKIKNFDQKIWDANKYNIVLQGNIYKFMNPVLQQRLLETKDYILVEASLYDKIWGIGLSIEDAENGKLWKGENLLGKAIMETRKHYSIK